MAPLFGWILNVGEPKVTACVVKRRPVVIESEQVQQRGVQVMHVPPVDLRRFYRSTQYPGRIGFRHGFVGCRHRFRKQYHDQHAAHEDDQIGCVTNHGAFFCPNDDLGNK